MSTPPFSLDVREQALTAPAEVALVVEGRTLSFGELAQQVDRLLRAWPTSRVILGLRCEPTYEGLVAFYAALASGHPTLLLHPRWSAAQTEEMLQRVGVQYVVEGGKLQAKLPGCEVELHPDAALLMATSGSCGRSKIVQHSGASLVAAARASEANLGWGPDERWLLSLPFAHVGGVSVLVRCLLARVGVFVAQGNFSDLNFLAQLNEQGVTRLSLVPTQLYDLLAACGGGPAPLDRLRWVLVGGAPAPLVLRQAAFQAGIPTLFTYGLTEAGSQVTTQRPSDQGSWPTTCDVGHPLPGVEVSLDATQRIQVRGAHLMLGYLDDPIMQTGHLTGSFESDGWFTTSDRGTFLEDGRLCLLGRVDHLIISGGENVDPEWVEQILSSAEGVAEVAILSEADPRWGEKIVALVVPRSGSDPQRLLLELSSFARAQLPSYAVPKEIRWVDRLPQLGIGKLDRTQLAALWSDSSLA